MMPFLLFKRRLRFRTSAATPMIALAAIALCVRVQSVTGAKLGLPNSSSSFGGSAGVDGSHAGVLGASVDQHARKSVNVEGRLAEFELQRATANAVRFSEGASWNTDGAVDIFVDDVRAVYKNFYDFARTYGLRLDDSATFQAFGEGLNEGQHGVDQNALPLSLAGAGTVREEEQEDLARDKQQRKLALKRDVADFLWLERMKVSTNSKQVVVFCDGSALGLADFARVAANDLLSLQAGTPAAGTPAAAGANEASHLLVGSFASVAFSSADLHQVGAAAGTGAGDPAESRAVAAERFGREMVRSTHRKLAENANDERMLDLGVREVTEDAGADENETAIAKLHNRVVVQAELRAILEGLDNAAGVSPVHGDDDVEEIVVFTDSDSALRVVRQGALATSSTPAARLAPVVGDEHYAKMFPHLFARVQDSVRMLQDRFARLRSVRFSYFPGHADKLTDSAGFHGAVDLMARRALGSRTGFLWDAGADWASTFAAAAVLVQNRSPTRRLRDLLRRRQSLVLQRLEVAASSTSKKRRRSAGPGGLTRALGGPADDPRSADPGRGPVQKRSLSELLTTSELAEWDAEHADAYRAIVAQKQADEEAAAEQGELVAALAEGMAKMDLNNNDGGQLPAANQGGQPVVDPSKAAFVTHSLRFIDSTLGDLGAAFTTEPLFQQTPPQLRGKVEGEKNLVWCARLGWAPEECLFPAEYADHGLFTALFARQGEAWRGRLNVLRKDLDTRSRKLVRFLDTSPEGRNAASYLPGTQAQQDEVQTWLRDGSARLTAALGAFTRLLSISLSPRVTEDDLYLRWKAALGRAAAYAPNVREDARLLQECEDAPACRAGPALVALKRNLMRLQLQPLWDVLGSAILVRETSTDLHHGEGESSTTGEQDESPPGAVDPCFSELSSSAESGASPEQGSEESDPSPPEQPCGSSPEDGNSPAAVAAVDGEQDAGATNEETVAVCAEVDVDVDAVHSPSEEDHVSGASNSTSDGGREPSDDADPTSITTTLAEFADELRHEEIAHLRTFELVVPPGSRPESDGGRLVWFPLRVRGRRGRAAAGDVEQMAQMDYSTTPPRETESRKWSVAFDAERFVDALATLEAAARDAEIAREAPHLQHLHNDLDAAVGQEDQDQHDARGVDRPSLLHDSALALPVRAFHASEEKLRLFAQIEESVNDFRVEQELHRQQRAAEKAAQMEEYWDGRRREEALRLVRSQRDFEARRATRESAAIGEVKARLVQGVLLAEARERLENTGIAANGLEGAMMSTGSASLGGGGRAEGTSVADMLAAVAAQPAERISVEQQEASTNDGYAELLRQKARRQRAGKSAREAGDVLAGSTSPLRQTTAQEKLLFRIEEELIARKLLPETDLQGKAAAGKAPLSREAAELLARNLLGLWTHDVKHHGRGRSRAGSPRAHRETGWDRLTQGGWSRFQGVEQVNTMEMNLKDTWSVTPPVKLLQGVSSARAAASSNATHTLSTPTSTPPAPAAEADRGSATAPSTPVGDQGDDEESDRIAAEAARILGEIPTEDFLEAADDDSDLEEEEEDRAREPDHQEDEGMGRDTDANGWSWYKVRRASQYDDFRQGWTQYDISGFENEGSRRLWPTTGADGHLGGRFVRLERDVYETVTVRPREESEGTTARLGEEVRVLVGRKGEIGRLLTPFPAAAEEEAHRGAAGPTNEAAHDLPPTAAPSFLYDLVMEAPGRKLYNTGGFSSGFSRLLSRVPRDAFRPVLLDDDRGATSDTFGLVGGLYSGHGFLPGPLAEVSRKFTLDVDRYAADVDHFLTRKLLARNESDLAEWVAAKVRERDEALDEMNDLENRPDRGLDYTNLKLLLLRNGHEDHAGALDAVRAFMRSLVQHGQGREKEEQLRRNTAAHDPDAVHESLRRLAVFLVVKVFVPLKELIARERAAEVAGAAAAQAQRGPGLLGDELERLVEAYMGNWFRSYARIAEQAVALGSATEWVSWIAPHDVAQDRPTVAGLVEALSRRSREKLLAYLRPRSSFWLIADWHPLYYQRNEMLLRRSLGEGRSAALATAVADAGAAQVARLRAGRLGDGLLRTGPGEATTPAAAVFDRLVANLERKIKEAVWTDMAVEECPADHVFGLHPTGGWSNPFRSSDAAAQRPGARPFLERGSAAGEQGTPEVGAGGAHRAGAGVSAPSAYRAEVERYLSDVRRARFEAGAAGGATSVFHSGELVRTIAGVFQTTRQLAGLTTASAALADALESHAETTKLKQSKGTALKVPIVSTTLTGRVDRRLRYFRHLLLQEAVLSTGRDLAEPPQAGPPSPTNSPLEPLAQEASRTTWGPVAGALATHLLELDVAEKTATEEEALKLVTKLAFSPSPAGPLASERRNKWRASQAAGVASKEALLFQMQGTEREQYRAFLQRARGLYVRSCGAARDASMLQPERAARGIVPVLESYLLEHGNISAKTRSNLAEWLRRLGLYTQESVFAARERQWEPQEFQAHQAHAFPEDLTEQNNFLRHFDATLARYHASAFSDMLAAVERLARPPEQTHRVVQTRIVPAALPSPADAVAASLTTTPSDGAGAPASATGTGGGVGSTAGEGVAADAEPSRSSKAAKHQRKRQEKAAAKELEAAAAKLLQSETASGRAGARRAAVALLQQCAETMQALPGFNLLDATEDGERASGEGPWLLSEERDNKENTLFPGQNKFVVERGADHEVSPEEFVDHVLGSVVAYPYEEKDYATCRENLKKALILEARGNINLSNGGAPHPEAARSFVAEYLKGRMARGSSSTGTSGNVVGTRNVVAAAAVETLQRVIAPRLVERPVEHMTNYFRSLLEALVAGFRREEEQKFGQGSPTTRLAARGAAEGPNNRNAFSLASAMQQVLRGTVLDTPALSAAPLGSPERGSAYVSVRVTSTGTSAVEDDILLKRVPATVYNARASSPWQPRLPETSRTRESKLRALALAWATFVRSGPGAALLGEQGSEDEGAASSLLKGHSYFLDDHAKQGFARAIEDLLALDSTEALFAHRAAFLESRLADWKTRRPGAALRAAAAATGEPSTSTSPHSFHYENPFAAELLEERAAPSEGESQRPVAADVGGDWFDEFKREVQKLLTKHGVKDRRALQRPPVNGSMHELLTTTFVEKSHVDQQVRYLANAKSRVADVLDRMYSEVSLYEIFFAAKLALRELVAAVFIEDEVEKDEGDRGHAAAAAHDVVADAAGDVEMMKEERVDGPPPLDDPRKIVEDEVRQFLLWEKVGQRQVRSVMAKEDRSSGSDYPRSNAVADEARLMEEWRAGRAGARFVPASADDERKLRHVLMSEADDETADGQEPGTGVLEVRVQRIATKGRPAPGVDTATGAAADDASAEEDEVDAGDAGAGTKTMGGRNKTSSLDVATPREAEHLVCNEARIAVLGPLGRPIRATKDSGAAAPGSSQLVAASPRAATFSAKELTKTHRAAELQNVRSRRNLHKGRAQFDNNSPLHFLVFSDAFDAFAAEQRGGESSFGFPLSGYDVPAVGSSTSTPSSMQEVANPGDLELSRRWWLPLLQPNRNGRKGVGVEVDPHEPHPVADALRKAFRATGMQVEELRRGETKSIQSGRLQSGTRVGKSGDSQIWFRVLPTARTKHAHAEPHTQTEAQSGSGAVKWQAYRTEDFVYQQLTRARAEQREERELLEERRVARAERAIALGYKNTDGEDNSELLQYRHSPKPGRGKPVLDEEFQFEPGDVILVEHIARLDLGAGAERLGFRVRRPLQPPATGEEAKLWLQDMSMSIKTK